MLKKEQIRDRMLKTAARLWDIPEGEIETNFDPLLQLLLETCAGELEYIGAGINASQGRLLDRLAELILPEAMLHARPASCILQAMPLETRSEIDEHIRFYTTQRIQQTGAAPYNQDFYFTPIGRFPLLKASLTYMKAGNRYYRTGPNGYKELIGEGNAQGLSNELWLALVPEKGLDSLKGLQLFFDLKGHSDAAAFYSSLHTTRAFAGAIPVSLAPGYADPGQFDLNIEEALGSGHDYSRKIHRKVAGVYQNRFLHLEEGLPAGAENMPDAWLDMPEKMLQSLSTEGAVFIRLELGRMFPQETLDRLSCSINAFPVVNRMLHSISHRTDPYINIIPMQLNGSFLDLHSIVSASGSRYKVRFSADSEPEEGEAVVRSSGVGKTNSREVRELIGMLTEAIRDESAYFSRMSNDFVLARLRDIGRILARLEDQLQVARDQKEPMHYLLLRPATAGEQVTIQYWTTQGAGAHAVRAGASLSAFNHTLTAAKGVTVLTNATGGKSTVNESEKKYLLQRQLMSGGKVVSIEDARLLSFQVFGDRLKKVEVRKGMQAGAGRDQGFRRSIDIFLTLAPQQGEAVREETEYLCSELEYHLNLNASPVYPFRILLC